MESKAEVNRDLTCLGDARVFAVAFFHALAFFLCACRFKSPKDRFG